MNGMTAIISVALLATGLLTSIMTPAIAASEADFRAAFAAAGGSLAVQTEGLPVYHTGRDFYVKSAAI